MEDFADKGRSPYKALISWILLASTILTSWIAIVQGSKFWDQRKKKLEKEARTKNGNRATKAKAAASEPPVSKEKILLVLSLLAALASGIALFCRSEDERFNREKGHLYPEVASQMGRALSSFQSRFLIPPGFTDGNIDHRKTEFQALFDETVGKLEKAKAKLRDKREEPEFPDDITTTPVGWLTRSRKGAR